MTEHHEITPSTTPPNARVIKESLRLVEPRAEEMTSYYHGRLFAENPVLRTLFPPSMASERGRAFRGLSEIVGNIDRPDRLAALLAQVGREHRRVGISTGHYAAMRRALLAALRRFTGQAWTAETESAWATACTTVTGILVRAVEKDAAHSPPWWIGEVVGHERRTSDITVLTVRPHQPLPYRAGQYITVQSARWPRVWRPYSIANAPRRDGLLRLHVRALPAGWVSGALARHTTVGDTLLLGAATGAMTLDAGSDRDVLCVAGGTGLAPVKALAEEAVAALGDRDVHLVIGARNRAELYDLPDLRALAADHPRLRVVPVVSDAPGSGAPRGPVPDVLDGLGDWSGHDAYVAGPPEMVHRTITTLRSLGVPPARIRHDPVDAAAVAAR